MKYNQIFVAGTFDRLHRGHEAVLNAAFLNGENVTIGITSDDFISHYKNQQQFINSAIEQFDIRKENVRRYLDDQKFTHPYEFLQIDDPYEPAASGAYEAIVVTSQNKKTGDEINAKRKALGLPELHLIEVLLLPAEDHQPISSTRIREGAIDREGNLYLPQDLRSALKEPLGEIIMADQISNRIPGQKIISVGDVTTDILLTRGIVPDLSIIDLYAQRKPYKKLKEFPFPESIVITYIQSGPGFISKEAMAAVGLWGATFPQTVLVIDGEDDLLVLPAILSAPVNSLLYYGQPNVGLVKVMITQSMWEIAKKYLARFLMV